MDNLNGLSSSATSYPSIPVKEKLLEVLESVEISLHHLLSLLELEVTPSQHFNTVHELVETYEEQHGQLSLQKWKCIFERFGYSQEFLCVTENFNELCRSPGGVEVAVASRTGCDQRDDEAGVSGNGLVSLRETLSHQDLQFMAMSAELPGRLAVIYSELDNGLLDSVMPAPKVAQGVLSPPAAQMPSSDCGPSLSLPAASPEDRKRQPEDQTHFANDSSTSITGVPSYADDSGFLSDLTMDNSVLLSGDDSSSSSSSSVLNSIVTKTEQQCLANVTNKSINVVPCGHFACLPLVSQSSTPTVSTQTSTTPVSKSNTPSRSQTSGPSSVTSQHSTSVSQDMVDDRSDGISDTHQQQNPTSGHRETHNGSSPFSIFGSDIASHGSEASLRSAARPAALSPSSCPFLTAACIRESKNCNASDNIGGIEELQKNIEKLHSGVIFMVEKLRKQTLRYKNVQERNSRSQQAFLECKYRCARLEEQIEQQTRYVTRSVELEAESERLLRMLQEMVEFKEEEYDRMEERTEAENRAQAVRINNLEQKNEELKTHLAESATAMTVKNETIRLQQEECNKLREDCKWLRQECDWLREEPGRLKETIRQLKVVIDHLDSRDAGATIADNQSDCIGDNQQLSESTLNCSFQSSAGEEEAGNGARITGSILSSDSGKSSDEEEQYEDAVEYL